MRREVMALLVVVAALALAACEPDARNDANLFLDRIERVDLDDPVESRRRLVDSLASLPLSAPRVQAARDSCVEAHRSVLTAESAHESAREALSEHGGDEEGLGIAERQRIEAQIRQSNTALTQSRRLFARCHELTRDLELRYRGRRRRSTGT